MEPFNKKVDIEVNDIQKAIKKKLQTKKPVKFTWEGLAKFWFNYLIQILFYQLKSLMDRLCKRLMSC